MGDPDRNLIGVHNLPHVVEALVNFGQFFLQVLQVALDLLSKPKGYGWDGLLIDIFVAGLDFLAELLEFVFLVGGECNFGRDFFHPGTLLFSEEVVVVEGGVDDEAGGLGHGGFEELLEEVVGGVDPLLAVGTTPVLSLMNGGVVYSDGVQDEGHVSVVLGQLLLQLVVQVVLVLDQLVPLQLSLPIPYVLALVHSQGLLLSALLPQLLHFFRQLRYFRLQQIHVDLLPLPRVPRRFPVLRQLVLVLRLNRQLQVVIQLRRVVVRLFLVVRRLPFVLLLRFPIAQL